MLNIQTKTWFMNNCRFKPCRSLSKVFFFNFYLQRNKNKGVFHINDDRGKLLTISTITNEHFLIFFFFLYIMTKKDTSTLINH